MGRDSAEVWIQLIYGKMCGGGGGDIFRQSFSHSRLKSRVVTEMFSIFSRKYWKKLVIIFHKYVKTTD